MKAFIVAVAVVVAGGLILIPLQNRFTKDKVVVLEGESSAYENEESPAAVESPGDNEVGQESKPLDPPPTKTLTISTITPDDNLVYTITGQHQNLSGHLGYAVLSDGKEYYIQYPRIRFESSSEWQQSNINVGDDEINEVRIVVVDKETDEEWQRLKAAGIFSGIDLPPSPHAETMAKRNLSHERN